MNRALKKILKLLLVFLTITAMIYPTYGSLVWGSSGQQLSGDSSMDLSDSGIGEEDDTDIEEWQEEWDDESEPSVSCPIIGEDSSDSIFTDTPVDSPDENPLPDENIPPENSTDIPTEALFSYGGGGGAASGSTAREELIRQPKLLLESCNLSEKELNPGAIEQLEVTLRNKSLKQPIYNLKISLANDSGELQLEKNSFYYDKVNPGSGIQLSETIKISGSIQSFCVPLVFTFSYEDSKGNAAADTETLKLIIRQPLRLELDAASIPEGLYASDTVEVPVKALNLSRTEAYNVRVTLSAPGLFPKEEAFLGNLEAGTAKDGTLRVYIGTRTMQTIGKDSGISDSDKYGPITGTITLQYEDASGTPYQIEEEFQTEIKKAQILSLKVEEEEKANPWWLSVFAAVFLAMAAVIGLLIHLIRRKSILLEEAKKERSIGHAPE